MKKVVLSVYEDELDKNKNLENAINLLRSREVEEIIGHPLRLLEMRNPFAINVSILPSRKDIIKRIEKLLIDNDFLISGWGSPFGKSPITEKFDKRKYIRFLDMVKYFESKGLLYMRSRLPTIRMYSFLMPYNIPENQLPNGHLLGNYRGEVIKRLKIMVKEAEKRGIICQHENEVDIFGDVSSRVVEIFKEIDSDYLKVTFDPANCIQSGENAVNHISQVVPWTTVVHLKDALYDIVDVKSNEFPKRGKVVLLGRGDSRIKDVFSVLYQNDFNGVMSAEYHLSSAGFAGGYTNKKDFLDSLRATKRLLSESRYAIEEV